MSAPASARRDFVWRGARRWPSVVLLEKEWQLAELASRECPPQRPCRSRARRHGRRWRRGKRVACRRARRGKLRPRHRQSAVSRRRCRHARRRCLEGRRPRHGGRRAGAWARFMARMTAPGGEATIVHKADALPRLLAAFATRFGSLKILPLHPRHGAPAQPRARARREGQPRSAADLAGFRPARGKRGLHARRARYPARRRRPSHVRGRLRAFPALAGAAAMA